METGRIKETINKRAIMKKIKKCRPEVKKGAGSDSQTVHLSLSGQGEDMVSVSDTVSAPLSLLGRKMEAYIEVQIYDILNRLFADGAEPAAMTAVILFPEQTEEAILRFFMDCLGKISEKETIEIADVKAECSPAVTEAVIMLTIFGKKKQSVSGAKGFLPGRELVMIGTAALEGTVMLEQAGRQMLSERFSGRFLESVRNLRSLCSIRKLVLAVQEQEPEAAVYCVGRNGVFGALWEIASASGKGFSVELSQIPVLQETIEICEFFDVNPYMLRSGGALLVAAEHGLPLVESCRRNHLPASVIGIMQNNADKLIRNGEECRYLDMPAAVKLLQNIPENLQWMY